MLVVAYLQLYPQPIGYLVKIAVLLKPRTRKIMSAPNQEATTHEVDPVEAIVPLIPVVLPVAGAVLMFLLAFIAVFMA